MVLGWLWKDAMVCAGVGASGVGSCVTVVVMVVVVHERCARKPVLLCDEQLSVRCRPNMSSQE